MVGRSDERWSWFNELLNSYHEQHKFAITPMSSGRAIQRPAEIQSHILEAGFRESTIRTEEYELIYASMQEWRDSKWTHGSRFALENMPDRLREQFHSEVLDHLSPLKEPDGFHEHLQVAWIMGTK